MTNLLLNKIDMAELLIQMGFSDVNPRADSYLGFCLLHSDNLTKSFSASLSKKVFMCFGCGRKGSAIDLYMIWRNVTYQQACSELGSLPNFRSLNALDMKLKTDKELPAYRKLEVLTEFTFFFSSLPTCVSGRAYMNGRGISDSTLEHFGVRGYPEEGTEDVFRTLLERFSAQEQEILTPWMFAEKYQIVFPYWFCGRVTWIQGRCIGEPPSKKESKYHNVSTALTYAYNHDVLLTETDTVYICEGAMDVLSMYELGYKSVIGLPGVNNFHANWLQDFKCKKVVLALDNDRAGQEGALKLTKMFSERGIIVERFQLAAEFKDVNDYLCKKILLER